MFSQREEYSFPSTISFVLALRTRERRAPQWKQLRTALLVYGREESGTPERDRTLNMANLLYTVYIEAAVLSNRCHLCTKTAQQRVSHSNRHAPVRMS